VTPDAADDLIGLRADERKRLERFAEVFDRLDAREYSTFAPTMEPEGVDEAQAHALEQLHSPERRRVLRGAIDRFVDAAAQGYSRRMTLTDTFLLNQSLPDRSEDRIRFAKSVERAVVGLVLWDELEDDDRTTLLGPWGAAVIPLIEDSSR
jgi:hypothetical protein